MYEFAERENDREALASVIYLTERSDLVMPSEFNDGWHHMETAYPQRESGLMGTLIEGARMKGYELGITVSPCERTWKDDDGVTLQEKGYRVDLKGPASQIEDTLVDACKEGYGIPERTGYTNWLHPIQSVRGYRIVQDTTNKLAQENHTETRKVEELEKGKWAFLKRERTYHPNEET